MRSTLERYQRIAPLYDLLDFPFEYGRYRHIRPQLFQRLSGRILDAGSGTGRNIAYYPAAADVVGIDLSPAMLARADKRAGEIRRKVELHQMDVTRLSFPAWSFDAARHGTSRMVERATGFDRLLQGGSLAWGDKGMISAEIRSLPLYKAT